MIIRLMIVVSFVLVSAISFSQNDTSIVQFKNAAALGLPNGYSHAAIIDLGNCQMVIISGQVPLDKNGHVIGKGDFAKQTEQVFLNIKEVLAAAGGNMDDLVKIGIYVTDISQVQIFRDVRNKFINLKRPPASTLVQVSKLFKDDVLLEVEAIAIISKK